MGITVPQTTYRVIPAGWYTAKLFSVEETEGKFGPQLKLQWDLGEVEGQQTELMSWCSKTFSSKSKLYEIATVLFKKQIKDGYALDTDHIIGREADVMVETKLTGDGKEFSKITRYAFAKSMTVKPVAADGDDNTPF